jgi:hypothetical protein
VSIAGLVCLAACDMFGVDGNGQRVTQTRQVDDFDRVDARGSLDVQVQSGEVVSAALRIDSNLIDKIETRVVGHELRIDNTEPFGSTLPGPHVLVSMPQLMAAKLSGSGRLAVAGFEQDADVALQLSGSGELAFSGKVPGLSVELSGSGEVSLEGSAEHEMLDLSGSGRIDARELAASDAALNLSGSGELRATVNGAVDVDLDGSGDIDLYGDYDVQRRSRKGGGSIREH